MEPQAWAQLGLSAAGILLMVGMHWQIVKGLQTDVSELKRDKVNKESYALDRANLGETLDGIETRCIAGRDHLDRRVLQLEGRR
jgi:hypothetical protein